jgi:hypothetical protein
MNDSDFAALRVRVYLNSFIKLYTRISDLAADEGGSRLHGTLYRFTAECPHCGTFTHYRKVAVPYGCDSPFFLACEKCHHRFTPPILKRPGEFSDLEKQAALARDFLSCGELHKAEGICRHNLSQLPSHAPTWHVFGKLMNLKGTPGRAFSAFYQAATYDAANPDILELLADTCSYGNIGELRPDETYGWRASTSFRLAPGKGGYGHYLCPLMFLAGRDDSDD